MQKYGTVVATQVILYVVFTTQDHFRFTKFIPKGLKGSRDLKTKFKEAKKIVVAKLYT